VYLLVRETGTDPPTALTASRPGARTELLIINTGEGDGDKVARKIADALCGTYVFERVKPRPVPVAVPPPARPAATTATAATASTTMAHVAAPAGAAVVTPTSAAAVLPVVRVRFVPHKWSIHPLHRLIDTLRALLPSVRVSAEIEDRVSPPATRFYENTDVSVLVWTNFSLDRIEWRDVSDWIRECCPVRKDGKRGRYVLAICRRNESMGQQRVFAPQYNLEKDVREGMTYVHLSYRKADGFDSEMARSHNSKAMKEMSEYVMGPAV